MAKKHPMTMTYSLGDEIPHGLMTWIKVAEWFGDELGYPREIASCYVPHWAVFNLVRTSSAPTQSELLAIWERKHIAIHVYSDASMTGELHCDLLTYDSKQSAGRSDANNGQVQDKSNNFREMMDLAATQYPGFMLGLPWANSFLVPIKRLIKPDMWGLSLALLALAWNVFNEWIR